MKIVSAKIFYVFMFLLICNQNLFGMSTAKTLWGGVKSLAKTVDDFCNAVTMRDAHDGREDEEGYEDVGDVSVADIKKSISCMAKKITKEILHLKGELGIAFMIIFTTVLTSYIANRGLRGHGTDECKRLLQNEDFLKKCKADKIFAAAGWKRGFAELFLETLETVEKNIADTILWPLGPFGTNVTINKLHTVILLSGYILTYVVLRVGNDSELKQKIWSYWMSLGISSAVSLFLSETFKVGPIQDCCTI